MMNEQEVVDGGDILSNALRAIKQYIPRKTEEVKRHAPTGDKSTPQYQLDAAHMMGYLKALEDLGTYIKSMGV